MNGLFNHHLSSTIQFLSRICLKKQKLNFKLLIMGNRIPNVHQCEMLVAKVLFIRGVLARLRADWPTVEIQHI